MCVVCCSLSAPDDVTKTPLLIPLTYLLYRQIALATSLARCPKQTRTNEIGFKPAVRLKCVPEDGVVGVQCDSCTHNSAETPAVIKRGALRGCWTAARSRGSHHEGSSLNRISQHHLIDWLLLQGRCVQNRLI